MASITSLFGALAFLLTLVLAVPYRSPGTISLASTSLHTHLSTHDPRALSPNVALKVLCVGDSITLEEDDGVTGQGETKGYRLDLFYLLQAGGVHTSFITTQRSGQNNPQPHNEDYGGLTIDEILSSMRSNDIISQQPNLVLVHAGANDNELWQLSNDPSTLSVAAPSRLGALLDFILCRCPEAVVLVAKVIQNEKYQAQSDAFNAALPGIVNERYMSGYKIRTVDMTNIVGMADMLHPSPAGYRSMAERWFSAIKAVPESWWSSTLTDSSSSHGRRETCARGRSHFTPAIGGKVVAAGALVNGGRSKGLAGAGSIDREPSISQPSDYGPALRLSDLDGDRRDDYLSVTGDSGVSAYLNKGQLPDDGWLWEQQANGKLVTLGHNGASRHQVHLADVNGDGRDDYLVVDDATGAVHCYLNRGASANGDWQWDMKGLIADGIGDGLSGAGVRFADFDGDGRADYIFLDDQAAAKVWLNQGPGDTLTNWLPINNGGATALAPRNEVQFADIDGDGKADYCWIHPEDGAVDVWYNEYSPGTINWVNAGQLIPGKGIPGCNIKFGRIGTSGRADYVAIDELDGSLKVWINECSEVASELAGSVGGSCPAPPLPSQASPESGEVLHTGEIPQSGEAAQTGETAQTGEAAQTSETAQTSEAAGTARVSMHSRSSESSGSTGDFQTLSTRTTATTRSEVITSQAEKGTFLAMTTTNAEGETVVQGSDGPLATLPSGLASKLTITQSNGLVLTYIPSSTDSLPSATNTPLDDPGAQTLNAGSSGIVTLPADLPSGTTITRNDGSGVSISASARQTTTNSWSFNSKTGSQEFFTDSKVLLSATTVAGSNGVILTLSPSRSKASAEFTTRPLLLSTTTNGAGATILRDSSTDVVTLPTGITAPFTTVANGVSVTFIPGAKTSSVEPAGVMIPYSATVPEPTSSDGSSVIPCKTWFFFICISWLDIDIGSWVLDFPTGTFPGPPRITFPPSLHIDFEIKGTLPPWPEITIGPDRVATYPPQPEDCKSESAEICLTSTSYGVSASSTTASQILSTCGTVLGCAATGSSRQTTMTSGCTSLTTTSKCDVSCTATALPGSPTRATSCTTATCSTISGCDLTVTGTTTTSTAEGCAYVPYTPWWTAATQQAPFLGDGGHGGTMVYGTFTRPTIPFIPESSTLSTTTSTSTSPSSAAVTSTTNAGAGSLTGLPTLSSQAYCTQTQCNGKQLLVPQTGSDCPPFIPQCTSTTSASPSPTTAAPSREVDQGILTCGTQPNQGNADFFFTSAEIGYAQLEFCTNLTISNPPVVFKPGSTTSMTGLYTKLTHRPIRVAAKWTSNDSGCPTTDMSATDALKLCRSRLDNAIDGCDTVKLNENYPFWKQGGKFFRDCITWQITSDANAIDL